MVRLASLFSLHSWSTIFWGGPRREPVCRLGLIINWPAIVHDRLALNLKPSKRLRSPWKFGPSPGDHLPWSSRTLGRFDQSATLLTLQKWYHAMRIKFQMFQTADHNDGTWSGLDFNPYRLSGLKSSYLAQRCASYLNQFLSVAAPPVIINQAKLTWDRFRSPLSPTDTNILIEN